MDNYLLSPEMFSHPYERINNRIAAHDNIFFRNPLS